MLKSMPQLFKLQISKKKEPMVVWGDKTLIKRETKRRKRRKRKNKLKKMMKPSNNSQNYILIIYNKD